MAYSVESQFQFLVHQKKVCAGTQLLTGWCEHIINVLSSSSQDPLHYIPYIPYIPY